MLKTTMLKTTTRPLYLLGFSLVVCATVLLCLSCGGGSGSGSSVSNSSDPPATVTPLNISDVKTVVQNAVTSVDAPMVVAVAAQPADVRAQGVRDPKAQHVAEEAL